MVEVVFLGYVLVIVACSLSAVWRDQRIPDHAILAYQEQKRRAAAQRYLDDCAQKFYRRQALPAATDRPLQPHLDPKLLVHS